MAGEYAGERCAPATPSGARIAFELLKQDGAFVLVSPSSVWGLPAGLHAVRPAPRQCGYQEHMAIAALMTFTMEVAPQIVPS